MAKVIQTFWIGFSSVGKTKPRKRNVREDKNVKKILKKWLDKYETLVREYIDNHGMDTRYEDESGL